MSPAALWNGLRKAARSAFDWALRPAFGATWVIFGLALLATLASSWVTFKSIEAADVERFELETQRVSDEITDIMRTYEHILRAGVGLFKASSTVTAQDWREFVATLDLDRTFPGIQGLGVVIVIEKAALASHIADMRRKFPRYDVLPPGERDSYTAIVHLEPKTWRNERAIGFDMFSEPTRRAAMVAARDNDEPRMSRGVVLVQEADDAPQSGILMYMPIFKSAKVRIEPAGAKVGALPAREHAGYVYAAFRMQDLFTRAVRNRLQPLLDTVALRVFDAPPGPNAMLLFDSTVARSDQTSAFDRSDTRLSRGISAGIAGQSWHMTFTALPGFVRPSDRLQPWMVLGVGSVISLLISSIAGALALARSQSIEAQRKLEGEMEVRKRAQEEVQVANQELIHRVKNMMAVVSSIAVQTARYTPDPKQFAVVFRERLAALGRVHDLLRPSPRFRPDLKLLVPEVLEPFAGKRRSAIVVEGPGLEISQTKAVMISLVLNELATNAVKYGAWSVAGGRVDVRWSIEEAAAASPPEEPIENIRMDWVESGGPPVEPPLHRGFGSNVVRFAIESGLRGSLETVYRPEGFRCTWRIPRISPTQGGPAGTHRF